MQPTSCDAASVMHHAVALQRMGRYDEARAAFDAALALEPEFADAHANRSHLHLLLGDFDRGWKEFEWRWRTQECAPLKLPFMRPLWLGEQPLEGRTILLHAEQGLGDTIQFVRYVPLVRACGAKVVLAVQPQLQALFSCIGAESVLSAVPRLPPADLHCPLMSLPLAFKTRLETIPADTPYLSVNENGAAAWMARLPKRKWYGGGRTRRVGVAWAGNPEFVDDETRSIGLANLAPLFSTKRVHFVSLQKNLRNGDREILQNHPQVTHLGDAIADFRDTAAIMSQLDLIITSDTSVAHLAGALGRPVWILLQFSPDWRWLLDRTDSPWYPTARLFRQRQLADWERVVEQVREALQ
jgi:hypothetical protein